MYPVDVAIAGNGDHVESNRAVGFSGGKVYMRCCDNARLFGAGDAFSRAAVFIGFTKSDFNNNQRLLVGHDEIEFALFAAKISTDRFKSFIDQKVMGLFFSAFTAN